MSKNYEHTIHHELSHEDAQTVTFNTVTRYAAEYNSLVNVEWVEACLAHITIKVPGSGELEGKISVGDRYIRMTIDNVPLSLRPFAPMAIKVIDKEARRRIDALRAQYP